MGAWGGGSFDNDDAMDWLAELEDSDDAEVLRSALDAVADADAGDYVEVPDASCALAAAEVIAAGSGAPAASLPPEALAWVSAHHDGVTAGMVRHAYQVVVRVAGDSELRELWDESAHRDEWRTVVIDLQRRLTAAIGVEPEALFENA
ncbi:MAG: DUF4259 domain-containing protein [Chloroflexi bacterium]|nr:DUF4259 domain-containing protein [Chloroflexota bacterium]